ncbi:MAG TPA: VWA domain-containing protein [Chiayiivirga sp.]|mgnify:CR=1 FL=1|nr:VWA domain-containing protein [Chiayiivirga sp.]
MQTANARALSAALFLALSCGAALAADPQQAILVLDASGSMWGQIDGRTKIDIAREAVDTMLDGWQGGELGLLAYGHHRKGDCADIELLIEPGAAQTEAIRQQVQSLNPVGMTPISASVRQAAERLRYTEQKATVILVSDGEETCNADPCALGAELERLGIDFTAHVIGFDISAGSTADAQLRCLAESTGGSYMLAGSAGELGRALGSVAEQANASAVAREGSDWMEGYSLESEVSLYMDPDGEESAGNFDFRTDQTAADCRALCEAESSCAGWHYEPAGSYFIEHPRCHLKGHRFAVRAIAQDAGWVAGIKPGVKLILSE